MNRNLLGLLIIILAFIICIVAGCKSIMICKATPRVVEVEYIDIEPSNCCDEFDCWGF
jgi:hypothetical protein